MRLRRCSAALWLSLVAAADAAGRSSGRGPPASRAADVARTAIDARQGSVLQIHATIYRDLLTASDIKYVISVDAIPEDQEPGAAMTERPPFRDEHPLALTWNPTASADMKSSSLQQVEIGYRAGSPHRLAYSGTGSLSLFIPFEPLSSGNDDMNEDGNDKNKDGEAALYMIGLWRRRKVATSEPSAAASLLAAAPTPRATSTERRYSEMECLARQVKRLPRTASAASLREQDLYATVKLVAVDREEQARQVGEASRRVIETNAASADSLASKVTPAPAGQAAKEKKGHWDKAVLVLVALVAATFAVGYGLFVDIRTLRWALESAAPETENQLGTRRSDNNQAVVIDDITTSLQKTTLRPPGTGPRVLFSPRLVRRRAEDTADEHRKDCGIDEDSSLTDGDDSCAQDDDSAEDATEETSDRDAGIGNHGRELPSQDDSSVGTLSLPKMERRMSVRTGLAFDDAIQKAMAMHVSAPAFVLAPQHQARQQDASVNYNPQLKEATGIQMAEGSGSGVEGRRPGGAHAKTAPETPCDYTTTIAVQGNEVHSPQNEHKAFGSRAGFQSPALPASRLLRVQSPSYQMATSENDDLHGKHSVGESATAVQPPGSNHNANLTSDCVSGVLNGDEVDQEKTSAHPVADVSGVTSGASTGTSHQEAKLVTAETTMSIPSRKYAGDQSDPVALPQRLDFFSSDARSSEKRKHVNVYGLDNNKKPKHYVNTKTMSTQVKSTSIDALMPSQQLAGRSDSPEISYVSTLPADSSRSSKPSPMDNFSWVESSNLRQLHFHSKSLPIIDSKLKYWYQTRVPHGMEFAEGAEQPEKVLWVNGDCSSIDITNPSPSKSVTNHLSVSLALNGTPGDDEVSQRAAIACADSQGVSPDSLSDVIVPDELDSNGLEIDSPTRLSSFLRLAEGSASGALLPEYVPSSKLEAAARMFSKPIPNFASQKILRGKRRGSQNNQYKSRRCPVNAKQHLHASSKVLGHLTTTTAAIDTSETRRVRFKTESSVAHVTRGRGDQKKRVLRRKQVPANTPDELRGNNKSPPPISESTSARVHHISARRSSGIPAEPHEERTYH